MNETHSTDPALSPPGLLRRLAAMLYDGLLLLALWMAGTLLWLLVRDGNAVAAGDPSFRFYLLLIAYAFFVGFWLAAGRTLGMQAWRLRLVNARDGGRVTGRDANLRFFAALLSWLPLGLGYWWGLLDTQARTWHDRLSGTRLMLVPKRVPGGGAPTSPHAAHPAQGDNQKY